MEMVNSEGRADVTTAMLFHLRGESSEQAGYNHILKKTLIDYISKTSRKNPQTTGICCRKHFFRFFYVVPVRKVIFGNILAESWHLSTIKTEASSSN